MENTNDRIENINKIFSHLELMGVDTNQPFLYGYFFIDEDDKKLKKLALKLQKKSFQPIFIKNQEGTFQLHIKKTETHTKETLLNQLLEFDEFAKSEKIKSFDGWDISNIDTSKPITSNQLENEIDDITEINLYNYAVELLENNLFDKAIIAFDKCIDKKIEIENSFYKQFICFDYLGDAENAILKLKEVLKINPNHFKACYNLGALSYDIEDYTDSVEYYKKASKINSDDDSVFYGISLSQYCLGNIEEAEINSKRALEINPKNKNAKQLLKMI